MYQYRELQLQQAERIAEIDAIHFIKNVWRKDDSGEYRLVEINWTDTELPNGFDWNLRRFREALENGGIAFGCFGGEKLIGYGKLIFVLYTVDDDGEPVQIFSSIERNRYYYADGIRFANIGSSGVDSSYATTLKLEGEGLVDMTFTTDPKDYVQMQLAPIAEGDKKDG